MRPDPFLAMLRDSAGQTGAMIAGRDWQATPLGSLTDWPQSLRTSLGLILRSPVPMVMLWGEDGVMLYNDAYSRFAGGRHPALLGSKVREGWPEVAAFNDNVMRVGLAGGTLAYADQELTLFRHGRPEQVWMNLDYSPVSGEDGQTVGVVAVVVETTARVLAERRVAAEEAALRNSIDRFRAAVEAVEGVVWTNDASGRMVGSQPGWASLTGQTEAEYAGYGWARAVHPDDAQPTIDAWNAAVAGQRTFVFTHRVRRQDGAWRIFDIRAVPVLDGGEIREWVGVHTDVTDQRAAESALRLMNETLEHRVAEALAERRLLADIVENTDAIVNVLDPGFRWLGVNRAASDAFEALYGIRPVLGASMLDPLEHLPEEREKVRALWSRALAGEEYTVVEVFGDPARVRRHYQIKFNVLRGSDGAQIGAYQYVLDVTERIEAEARLARAEDALRQAQKMETVGQLTGGIAHDFNNLLGAVVGSLDLIRRRAEEPERVRAYAQAALQVAQRGAKLTGQLLAFSRAQRIELKPLDVAGLVQDMQDLLARTLGPAVRLALVPCAGAVVLSDATQLEMAVLNMAINARDAMPGGGALTIAVAVASLQGDAELPDGEYVQLCVADTGTGMPPEVIPRVFDPFFTTKGVGKGTGLGLSQVYGIARQTGGAVRIESQVGVGTVVRVLLPQSALAVAPGDATPTDGPGAADRGATVLVVDDDDDLRRTLVDLLDALGYRVVQASGGPSGLQALETGPEPDLMILDFAMPGMNGAEVARAARAIRPGLPIVFASGYSDTLAIEQAAGPGTEVLRKPFGVDELQAVVAGALAGVARPAVRDPDGGRSS